MFAGKIVGLDELAAQASKAGRFDYDARVDGLATPDRYTLRIQLRDTDFNFSHVLAFSLSGAVAREVIEEIAAFPVGEHDDFVDTTTQALLRFRQGGFISLDSDEKDEPRFFRRQVAYY